MCRYLQSQLDDSHQEMKTSILDPLLATLADFDKLKEMLEKCIDISAAKQNDYVINPNFDDSLKELSTDI
jgi:hypothetical protein